MDICLFGELKSKRIWYNFRWIIPVGFTVEVLKHYVLEIMKIKQLEFAVQATNHYQLSHFDLIFMYFEFYIIYFIS